MPWFYVDDGFSDSKPVLNMPARHRLAACGLWVLAGSWAAKEETDGRVPEEKLRQLGARPALIDVLTNESEFGAPLWSRVGREVQFNSWAKWQKTHAELVKQRAAAAERQRESRGRKLKGRNAVTSDDDELSQCDSRVTDNVTETAVTRDVTRDPHVRARRPDPTRPDPDLLVTKKGGVTQVDAHDTNTPRPQCPDHETNHTGPCHHCQARREWDKTEAQRRANQLIAAKHQRAAETAAAIAACQLCDPDGYLPAGTVCNHDAHQADTNTRGIAAVRAALAAKEAPADA